MPHPHQDGPATGLPRPNFRLGGQQPSMREVCHKTSVVKGTTADLQDGHPPTLLNLLVELEAAEWVSKGSGVKDVNARTLHEEAGDHVLLAGIPHHHRLPGMLRWCPVDLHIRSVRLSLSSILLKVWGWVMFVMLLWPQMLAGIALSLFVHFALNKSMVMGKFDRDDMQRVHGLFGTILSFTIVFRTNAAYDRFYEGRRLIGTIKDHIRELVLEAYASLPHLDKAQAAATSAEEKAAIVELRKVPTELRRKLLIAFAFIRQDLRESMDGFLPGSTLAEEGVHFHPSENFFMDPCRPRLWDLMTKDDLVKYATLPVPVRAAVVVGEIKRLLPDFIKHIKPSPVPFANKSNLHLMGLLDCLESCQRIRDTPVPYPYIVVLNLTTFFFVYATPFLYFDAGTAGTFIGVQLLALSYYGVLKIGLQLENPFGYDPFDLPIESFGLALHNELLAIAKGLSDDHVSFVPDYLSVDPTPPALHTRSISKRVVTTKQMSWRHVSGVLDQSDSESNGGPSMVRELSVHEEEPEQDGGEEPESGEGKALPGDEELKSAVHTFRSRRRI